MHARGNPEEIRKFASQLKAFNSQLQTMTGSLQSQYRQLGQTWEDKRYERFSQEFEQIVRVIRQFQKTSEQQIPILLRDAQKLDDYLRG